MALLIIFLIQITYQFNSENGTFTFRGEERGSFYIEGEGIFRHWTEEAIKRAGFGISETMTIPYIKLIAWMAKNGNLISKSKSERFQLNL